MAKFPMSDTYIVPFDLWKIDSWEDKKYWDLMQRMSVVIQKGIDLYSFDFMCNKYGEANQEYICPLVHDRLRILADIKCVETKNRGVFWGIGMFPYSFLWEGGVIGMDRQPAEEK